jgi:hypothetical protein
MNTIFRIIEQTDYDRYVFLTEEDGNVIGINYHQGIGDLHPDYYEADSLMTSIYLSLTTLHKEERIIKAIELHQKATIFQDRRTITIPSEQMTLVRKALNYYRECINKFSDVVTDNQEHDLYDLIQLEAMFNYEISVEMTDSEHKYFCGKHGVDLPYYYHEPHKHMENLNEQLTKLVEESLDYIFVQAHSIAETKSGDISPEQHFKYSDIQRELTNLLIKQVTQNL